MFAIVLIQVLLTVSGNADVLNSYRVYQQLFLQQLYHFTWR